MADDQAEKKLCSNCKKMISSANFMMHEAHCRRHIVLCQHCAEPVPKADMEEHFTDLHAKVVCTLCGESVEKPLLKQHMDNLCSKKPKRCPYCELELPGTDLAAHQDYCGTRTEACPACGQFIMKQDQLQHEASNCDYPTPKPSTNGHSDTGQNQDLDYDGFEFADTGHFINPFAMNELSRIMESARVPEVLNSRVDIAGFGRRGRNESMQSRSYTNNNTTSSQKSTTNRRSELNKQRQQVTEPDVAEDADRLLALSLQQEDDLEIDSLIRHLEKEPPASRSATVTHPHIPASYNTFPDDDELIPCEFCGETFPMDMLVQHQSSCDPQSTGQWNDTAWMGERNNEVPGVPRGQSTMSIPVINNLDSPWSQHVLQSPVERSWKSPSHSPPGGNFLDEEGEIIIPCEFCDEPFPYELLIQHQSVCDLNPTMTPRVQTPASPTHRKPRSRGRNVLSEAAQEVLEESTRAQRHQGLPTWGYGDNHGDNDDSEDEIIDYLQLESRNCGESSFGGSRNEGLPESKKEGPPRSVASKYGAPVSEYDDYLTRGPRPTGRTGDEGIRRIRSGNSRRTSDTRATLDRLLSDEPVAEHDLLNSVGNSRQKSVKNEDNYLKRGNHAGTGGKKRSTPNTGSSTRDVMRELGRPTNAASSQRPKKRVSGSSLADGTPPFDIRPVGHGSQRQRASHVFNPEVRGRSSHTRSTRQKPPGRRHYGDEDNY